MDNIDIRVLKQIKAWRGHNLDILWVTVLQTWGSSPRPIGSMMAINADGIVIGSVSGGCIEDDLIRQRDKYIKAGKTAKTPQKLKYGINASEAHKFGLPCGGTIELLVEYNPEIKLLDQLIQAIEQRQTVIKSISLENGSVEVLSTDIQGTINCTDQYVQHFFGSTYRLLIIGSGQLSEYLATMALFNDFEVIVCDPRPEYNDTWQVQGAQIVTGMPDDEVIALKPDDRSCIVALTHDPKLDDMALLEALVSPALYVGAIGSRRNQAKRRYRLKQYFDIPDQALARLRGPVGLDIGSKKPAEIAVSIMADIIAVKNNIQRL